MNIEQKKIKQVLKQLMKKNGFTYEMVADELKVSPATVKRRLNMGDLTLDQLAELAQLFGISFYELLESSKTQDMNEYIFTEAQEDLLAEDVKHILFFRDILRGFTFDELRAEYKLTEAEIRKLLRLMEEVQLIKLLPYDRITCVVQFPFRWRSNGRLENTYYSKILKKITDRATFLDRDYYGNMDDKNLFYRSFEFLLDEKAQLAFCKELHDIYSKYRSYSQMEMLDKNKTALPFSGILLVDKFTIWS